jgi:hypothetical protein
MKTLLKTLAKRLTRSGVWTSLPLACCFMPLAAVCPLAWWAVGVNLAAAGVNLLLP